MGPAEQPRNHRPTAAIRLRLAYERMSARIGPSDPPPNLHARGQWQPDRHLPTVLKRTGFRDPDAIRSYFRSINNSLLFLHGAAPCLDHPGIPYASHNLEQLAQIKRFRHITVGNLA